MSVIKRCYRGVLLMRVQSCYYLKRFCGATKRMPEMGLRLEYHSDGNMYVCMYNIYIYACECIYEMRFVVFPSDANRRVGILFRFCTKWSLYTNVGIYCETVTYNCVLKRSETLFKGRHRHSFREIDNTKLHNTCNLSTTTRNSLLGRVERGLRKGILL